MPRAWTDEMAPVRSPTSRLSRASAIKVTPYPWRRHHDSSAPSAEHSNAAHQRFPNETGAPTAARPAQKRAEAAWHRDFARPNSTLVEAASNIRMTATLRLLNRQPPIDPTTSCAPLSRFGLDQHPGTIAGAGTITPPLIGWLPAKTYATVCLRYLKRPLRQSHCLCVPLPSAA